MTKKTKKRLIILTSILGVLTLILFGAGKLLENRFEKIVRGALDDIFMPNIDHLDVDFSFLKHFPHPSLSISDLRLVSRQEGEAKEIMKVANADFQFDIYKFIFGDYALRVVKISDGDLLFYTNREGVNIRPFHYNEVEEAREKQTFTLSFPKIELENITVRGVNHFKKADWVVSASSADLKGELVGTKIFLEGDLTANLDHFLKDGKPIIENLPIALTTNFEMDNEAKVSHFSNSLIKLYDAEFDAEGKITVQYPQGSILDIKLTGKDGFESVLGLFPKEITQKFKQTNPEATIETQMLISGLGGPMHSSKIDIQLVAKDAKIEMTEYSAAFEEVDFEVTYTTGESISRVDNHLIVNNLSAKLNDRPILLNIDLINLDTPDVNLDFDLDIDLHDFLKIFPVDGVDDIGGILKIKGDYQAKGVLVENLQPDVQLDGTIELNNDLLSVGGKDFKNLNGKVFIKNDQIDFNSITGTFSSIPFKIKGGAKNIYRLLFDTKKNVYANLDIDCEAIYLNSIFQVLSKKGGGKNKKRRGHPLDFPDYLRGNIKLSAPQLFYRDVVAKNIKTHLKIERKRVSIPLLRMDVLGGTFALNGRFDKNLRDNFSLYSNVHVKNLNTKTLLRLFNDFTQNVLTSKQVAGRLTADLKLSGEVGKDLQFLEDDFSYHADFSFKDGELNDFEPLTKAFNFLKKEEAANVRIQDLKGEAIYHKKQMLIPDLHFNSNLSYITLFGQRDANESLKWYVEVSLADLLFKSRKKKKEELTGKRIGGKGKMRARVEISGQPHQLGVKPKSKIGFADEKKEVFRKFRKKKKGYFNW